MPPKLDGILESSLYVDDLRRAVRFYQGIFGFPVISDSVSAVARCTQARAKYCCSSRKELRGRLYLRTMATANCISHLRFRPLSWPHGNHGLQSRELRWKRNAPGN